MQFSIRRGSRGWRGVAAAAVALAAGLSLAACGSSDNGDSSSSGGTTSITVGVIPILDVAPLYLGVKKGFFSDEGLDVTLETAQGGAAIVPAVVSGQYQFGFSNTVSLILGNAQGLGLKGVASGVNSTGVDGNDFGAVIVPKNSKIKTAADLAGKKIAVNTLNNINTLTINAAVRAAGGDPTTIEYVELPFPDIAPAVTKGDVDAGQVVEPFLTIGQGQGNVQMLSNFAVTAPNLMVAEYFTSQKYADANPDVVDKFTSAMEKSLAYAKDNPDEARAILSDYTSLEPDLQSQVVLPQWLPNVDENSINVLADLAVQDGLLDSTPDTSALVP